MGELIFTKLCVQKSFFVYGAIDTFVGTIPLILQQNSFSSSGSTSSTRHSRVGIIFCMEIEICW